MIVVMERDRRAGLAGVTLVVVLAAAACGGGHEAAGHNPTTATEGTTTTSTFAAPTSSTVPGKTTTTVRRIAPTTIHRPPVPPAPSGAAGTEQAALARLVMAYPPKSSVTSPILHTGSLTYVAVAHDVGGLTALIDIYAYQGSTFVDVAPNIGSGQDLDPVDPTTIRTGDVTGGPFPDLLVPLTAGDHDNGVLVSYFGGSWQLIGVSERTGAGASDELVQPNILGNEVTQSVNDCSPDCAQGTYSVTTYLFDPQLGKLVATGPTVQSPSA
jgi:hypothetical protein